VRVFVPSGTKPVITVTAESSQKPKGKVHEVDESLAVLVSQNRADEFNDFDEFDEFGEFGEFWQF